MSLSEPQSDPQRPPQPRMPRDSAQHPQPQPELAQAGQPEAPLPTEFDARDETVIGSITGTLHRAPRYTNFMILGAILGVLSALILTLTFPENAEFSQAQVFGFLLLAGVAGGVALGSVIALLLDKVVGRRTSTVVADRLGRGESRADEAPGTVTGTSASDAPDTRTINNNEM